MRTGRLIVKYWDLVNNSLQLLKTKWPKCVNLKFGRAKVKNTPQLLYVNLFVPSHTEETKIVLGLLRKDDGIPSGFGKKSHFFLPPAKKSPSF